VVIGRAQPALRFRAKLALLAEGARLDKLDRETPGIGQ
jgi:hypothetical protein